jgi:uroporphyrinogen decarboxylase
MKPRENFILALEGKQPVGRVPHFELVFYLTMEAFGRVHPSHRSFTQWDQMSETERNLHRRDIADLLLATARRYEHSAILYHPPAPWDHDLTEECLRTIAIMREMSGDEYFVMMGGDPTYAIPSGGDIMDFVCKIADNPQRMKDEAKARVETELEKAKIIKKEGIVDGFALCSDYCFNNTPFLSPGMFDEFVTPYLTEIIAGYREMGFYTIKHTDGNIMPILDSLVSARPHALHSLDPQGGVDIAEVKRLVGDKVCLIGNVDCGLMDTGTDQEVIESARYALKSGMKGGGYIFSTSNSVYTGMKLKRYELMLDVWRKEGNYE